MPSFRELFGSPEYLGGLQRGIAGAGLGLSDYLQRQQEQKLLEEERALKTQQREEELGMKLYGAGLEEVPYGPQPMGTRPATVSFGGRQFRPTEQALQEQQLTTAQAQLKAQKTLFDIQKVTQDIKASETLTKKRITEMASPRDKARLDTAKRLISDAYDLTDGFTSITEQDKPILEDAFKTLGVTAKIEEIKENPGLLGNILTFGKEVATLGMYEKPKVFELKGFGVDQLSNMSDQQLQSLLQSIGADQASRIQQ